MRNKIISVAEAVDMIPDGATIMYGGFLGCGSAHHIIDALAEKGTKDLTIIGNDCGMATGPLGEEYYGVAKLVHNHQVKHVIATHVGMTPDVGTQGMVDKTLTVDLIPQGSLAEMIRAGGAGLGGVLTKTGLGTVVEEGKQVITVNGERHLLETALHADVALTRCRRADPIGNLTYSGSSGHASHPVVATCGTLSIVECDHFCDLLRRMNDVISAHFISSESRGARHIPRLWEARNLFSKAGIFRYSIRSAGTSVPCKRKDGSSPFPKSRRYAGRAHRRRNRKRLPVSAWRRFCCSLHRIYGR